MKIQASLRKRGFTLMETVIAIGVLAVLLTGFIIVFAPAAAGIKKAISVQEADRLVSTLEQELVTLRGTTQTSTFKTGFDKGFEWLKSSNSANEALLIYQYRGSVSSLRKDGTPEPVVSTNDKLAGKGYNVLTMVRRKSDSLFKEDLQAVEGAVFFVKCTQLVFDGGGLKTGAPGIIKDPKAGGAAAADASAYPEAVIAFSAEFHSVPAKSAAYFDTKFISTFTKAKNPVFARNLAARR
jgi:prepilin-type N-terminal cleavage/methylation domain-containing protein